MLVFRGEILASIRVWGITGITEYQTEFWWFDSIQWACSCKFHEFEGDVTWFYFPLQATKRIQLESELAWAPIMWWLQFSTISVFILAVLELVGRLNCRLDMFRQGFLQFFVGRHCLIGISFGCTRGGKSFRTFGNVKLENALVFPFFIEYARSHQSWMWPW